MYKDVAKRILAVILTFCMIGTMPDTALLASGMNSEITNTEVDETDIGTAAEDSEEKDVLGGSETSDLTETETEADQKEDDISAPISGRQNENAAAKAASVDAPTAREGEISLGNSIISKPEKLPNQVRGTIPVDGGFVTNEIVGLDIYNTETNVKLRQRVSETSTDGDYTVTAEITGESTARLTITGVGSYTGTLTRDVTIGKDIQDGTVRVTAIWDGNETTVNGSQTLQYDYEGRRIDPEVKIADQDRGDLREGVDYEVIRPEEGNLNVGQGKVTIQGIGFYAGTREVNFEISAVRLSTLYELTLKTDRVPYNKKAAGTTEGILPGLTVINRTTGETVYDSDDPSKTGNADFQFTYDNNKSYTNAEASVGLTAGSSRNCTGTVNPRSFWITRADVNDLQAEVTGDS